MIISFGRRYIFVHMPKTGGTALALALEERAMADDILIGDTPKAKRRRKRVKGLKAHGRLWKHSTLADIDGVVSPVDMKGFLVVSLVRNPWDRLVSYYHWLGDQTFEHPAVDLAKSLEFSAFVKAPHVQQSLRSAPAAHYVTDATGVEQTTLFLRLEHLVKDIEPFEAHLGFTLAIPHANKSRRVADYRSYYDDETRALVAEFCSADIARFGYRF